MKKALIELKSEASVLLDIHMSDPNGIPKQVLGKFLNKVIDYNEKQRTVVRTNGIPFLPKTMIPKMPTVKSPLK
jgi:hypothetical protein